MAKQKKIDYYYAVGRRKESVARVRIYRGKGENTVNSQVATKYFEGAVAEKLLAKPFGAVDASDKFYYSARVTGGGVNGQLAAVILGLARALVKIAPEKNRVALRKLNLLTRDARTKERRMVGTGGKARRKKQSPKR